VRHCSKWEIDHGLASHDYYTQQSVPDMDIPPTEEEARSHIRLIRHAKGLDGPETNTSDLENALIM